MTTTSQATRVTTMAKKTRNKRPAPRYHAGWPVAAEQVFVQRVTDNARTVTGWVYEACINCYKAVAASGARFNPLANNDAADGKDVSVADLAGDRVSGRAAKRIEKYLKHQAGASWSRLTRARQASFISAMLDAIEPADVASDSQVKKLVAALCADGEFGAVPAYIISDVRKKSATALAQNYAKSQGVTVTGAVDVIAENAQVFQDSITAKKFGLNDEYWENYYRRFRTDQAILVDLRTGAAVSADTVGAMSETAAALADGVAESAAIQYLPSIDALRQDALNAAADELQIIVKAAKSHQLAEGVEFPAGSDAGDLISVNKFANDPELLRETERLIEQSMSVIEDVTDDALKRGVGVVQEAIREGRGLSWTRDELAKQMDITVRRARNIAINETGNLFWATEEASARSCGMRLYRWRGMMDERERKHHVDREGVAFDPKKPPPDGNPGQPHGCRCYPEWLWDKDDVEEAEQEIQLRLAA